LQVKTPRRRLRKRAIEPGEISVASKWGYTYTAGWSPSATQHEVKDVDTTQLDGAFAHRVFDDSLLADLPIGVGPCGERVEFHTFVSDSPGYKASPLRRQAEESRARRLHEKTASRTERNDQKQGSVA
jgi:hypothetical protein